MVDRIETHDRQRRQLVLGAASALTLAATPLSAIPSESATPPSSAAPQGPHRLPPLPYPDSALAPRISAETLALHYGKHHRGYVDKLNGLLAKDPRRQYSLEALMQATAGRPADAAIYNNAAQIWNHTFYWRSLAPLDGGGRPSGPIAKVIDRDFGDFASLRTRLAEAANSQFGSGWAWLVVQDGKLSVAKTGDAENPLLTGARPLLTIDVWEHAYYVDYRNRRADYVAAVIDGLLDWRFAQANLARD